MYIHFLSQWPSGKNIFFSIMIPLEIVCHVSTHIFIIWNQPKSESYTLEGCQINLDLHKACHDFPGGNAAFQLLGRFFVELILLLLELQERLAHRGISLGHRKLGIGITLINTR